MFCINCGTKLDENTKFCPSCGTKIEKKEEAKEEVKEEKVEEAEEAVEETAEETVIEEEKEEVVEQEEVKEEEEEVKEEPKPEPVYKQTYTPPPVQPVYNAPPKKSGGGVVAAILIILILLVVGGGTLALIGIGTGFIKFDFGNDKPGVVEKPDPIVEPEPDPVKPEVHNMLTVSWKGFSFSIPEEFEFETDDSYAAFGTDDVLYQLSVHNLSYYEVKAGKERLLKTIQLSEEETLRVTKVDVTKYDGKEYVEAYGESESLIYHYFVTGTGENNEVVAIAVLYEKGTMRKSDVTPVITKVIGSLKRVSRDYEGSSSSDLVSDFDDLSLLDEEDE
jgi:hypothetical protein